ncbi:GntR family transcriptional regulator [Actinomycetospora sp. NBRC 106375]|uniref:GntR family transcriptional regulator n=1 Tax=Actinomycetospora sp. NBRC 106375 TaxID=3032207 RepID=UPI0024A17B70|nr:GntR family transcriptional regulator [Actinomycetospora sp. NBRC 106375]GLZ45425.1 GntR family transcriptional regulator [Actinomycetospora sp. NBRC 106375]
MTGAEAVLGDAPALPEQVALQLRERILSGVLRPGTFLRPDRLAVELGVSPTPVREALQALRADDMVRALPRRGFVVAPLDRDDVVDLFAVQAQLTGELAARAASVLDADGVAGLRALADEVDAIIEGGEPGDLALAEAEHRFHAALNRAAGARKLAWLVGRAAHYLPPRFYTDRQAWRTATVAAHRDLLDALASGDADTARAAMEGHVLDGRDLLVAHLEAVGFWDETR